MRIRLARSRQLLHATGHPLSLEITVFASFLFIKKKKSRVETKGKNKVKCNECEKDTLRDAVKRAMGPDRKRGCLQICLPQTQMPVGIIRAHAHRHTGLCTQMHSDKPSAPAKCCLIQPDLHLTEKANSLPLRVWKTERSSNKMAVL